MRLPPTQPPHCFAETPHHPRCTASPTAGTKTEQSPGARNAPHNYARNATASIVQIKRVKEAGVARAAPLYTCPVLDT